MPALSRRSEAKARMLIERERSAGRAIDDALSSSQRSLTRIGERGGDAEVVSLLLIIRSEKQKLKSSLRQSTEGVLQRSWRRPVACLRSSAYAE